MLGKCGKILWPLWHAVSAMRYISFPFNLGLYSITKIYFRHHPADIIWCEKLRVLGKCGKILWPLWHAVSAMQLIGHQINFKGGRNFCSIFCTSLVSIAGTYCSCNNALLCATNFGNDRTPDKFQRREEQYERSIKNLGGVEIPAQMLGISLSNNFKNSFSLSCKWPTCFTLAT